MIETRRVHLLLLCLTLALACGGGGSENGDGQKAERAFLSIGTAPVVGGFYLMGSALGEALNANPGSINWQVTAEATKGSQENIRRLQQGQIELALSNAAITYHAVRGEANWDQPYDIKALMTLAPNVAQFVTTSDSGIETLADLKGKTITLRFKLRTASLYSFWVGGSQ